MRALLQRVSKASVSVDGNTVGICHRGWFILLGIHHDDKPEDLSSLVKKIASLRGFADENDKMNLDIKAIDGEILVVSQFTLYADLARGNRPGFSEAAAPEYAKNLYELFISGLKAEGIRVQTGIFGAQMLIHTNCDGPVTFLLETGNKR